MKRWIVLAGLLGIAAGGARGQVACDDLFLTEKFSISVANRTFEEIIEETESRTSFRFFFDPILRDDLAELPRLEIRDQVMISVIRGYARFFEVKFARVGCLVFMLPLEGETLSRVASINTATKVLRDTLGLAVLSPEEARQFDLNRDGRITIPDASLWIYLAVNLQSMEFYVPPEE